MKQMASKGHLTFKYQIGGVHCPEREREQTPQPLRKPHTLNN